MSRYIVTDLTRFNKPDDVCTAVIDMDSGCCLRPIPYFKSETVEELNMHPGAILQGEIILKPSSRNPHIEDATYKGLKYEGPASGDEFKEHLDRSLCDSVASGFGVPFTVRQKHIPVGTKTLRSIITIKINPADLSIHEDDYNAGKIKATFSDGTGKSFHYLSITDRGFFDFAKKHQDDGELGNLERSILSQDEVYLRIGLSRNHKAPDGREGYWLQVNGIYTFPKYLPEIRSY